MIENDRKSDKYLDKHRGGSLYMFRFTENQMRILVISDTHGRIYNAVKVCETLQDMDLIVHLGDKISDAEIISDSVGKPIIAVNGNCDFGFSVDNEKIINTPKGDVLLVHGHQYAVKHNTNRLVQIAKEKGCIAAFYGHTHVSEYSCIDGIHILNPGSISLPKEGDACSYAVVHITEKNFEVNIIKL